MGITSTFTTPAAAEPSSLHPAAGIHADADADANARAAGGGPALPAMFDRYRQHLASALAQAMPPLGGHPVNPVLHYHLGWADRAGAPTPVPAAQGKALRPTLCMFACDALGGEPRRAAPAAAALELIHNFSLLHDDIQDEGPERRHQPSVWALWGTPRALVAGNAMQSLGDLAALNRRPDTWRSDALFPDVLFPDAGRVGAPAAVVGRVSALLTQSYLEMIEGQCRDLQFEQRDTIGVDEYLAMIALKTGALIRSSLVIGAAIATADGDPAAGAAIARFGRAIGRLFQIRDDYLGIWGDAAVTGKSSDSDIVQRKKSYPIVYAFQQADGAVRQELRRLYGGGATMDADAVARVLDILDGLGAARRTDALTAATAREARAALADIRLPRWAMDDADNLIDFMAYRLF